MKHQNYFLLILFVLLTSFSQAQIQNQTVTKPEELPMTIPPSPTVANLMRFEEVPVNHYTGVPDISIPLFAQKLSNHINLNIGLNYNPAGIRVDERSGWTGTGWSLNAESVISRTVMDVPDEIYSIGSAGGYGPGDIGTFSNDFYNLSNLDFGTATFEKLEQWQKFVWETANGVQHQDYQPDLFQFSFFGYSGRFIILNINGVLQPKIISSDQKVKININYISQNGPNAYELVSFEVIDPYGNKFLFEDKEETVSTSRKTGMYHRGGVISDNLSSIPKEMTYISSWKLSNIRTANNVQLATYTYYDVQESFNTPQSIERSTIENYTNTPPALLGSTASAVAALMPPKYIATWSLLQISSKKLKEITLRDATKVKFDILSFHPEYLSCSLTSMTVKDVNLNQIKKFEFFYQTTNHGRLFMDYLNDISTQNKILKYDLTYKNENELPEFGNDDKDIWGYYNGGESFYNPEVYESNAKTGVLTSISYPTGGKKEFDFELNQIGYIGQSLADVFKLKENRKYQSSGVHFDGDVSENSQDLPLPQRFFFYLDVNQTVDITYNTLETISNAINYDNHKLELCSVQFNSNPPYNPNYTGPQYFPQNEGDVTNIVSLMDFDLLPTTQSIVINKNLSPGFYMLRVKTKNQYLLNYNANAPVHTNLKVDTVVRLSKFEYNTRNLRGGGLRIKSIRFTQNGADLIKTDFDYSLKASDSSLLNPDPGDPNKPISSGAFEGSILMDRTYIKSMDLITPVDCPPRFGTISGLPSTNYKFKVTKRLNSVLAQMTKGNYVGYKDVSVSKTGNGRTDYEFTNALDYPTYPDSYYQSIPPYFEAPVVDLDHKRGLKLKESVFEEHGNKIKQIINDYNFDILATYNYVYFYYLANCPTNMFYLFYEDYLANTASTDAVCNADYSPGNTPNCGAPSNYIALRSVQHVWGKTNLKETISTDYFYDSENNQTSTGTRQTFEYNSQNFQMSEQNIFFNEVGVEQNYKTKFFYPVGGVPSNYNNPAIAIKLKNLNKINEVLATESYKNGELLSRLHNQYYEFWPNLVLPIAVKVGKKETTPENRAEFLRYDLYGNLLEVTKSDGTHISYIWGYNNTYPVAQLVGVTFASIEEFFGDDFNSGTSGLTVQNIESLKMYFPYSQISIYEYKPGVGIISATDPRGERTAYEYDDYNRLVQVKDSDGHLLSKNSYNYKN